MNHPVDGRLIASSQFRDAFARAILEGVGRYRNAIAGRRDYQPPSAVASATDKSSIPDLRPSISPALTRPSLNEAVQRAAEEIKKRAAAASTPTPAPSPNAN
jgi:hypothetical protein